MPRYPLTRLAMCLSLGLFIVCAHPTTILAQQSVQTVGLRDLNQHCPFTPPSSLDQWQPRADQLRLQMRVSLGLFPEPNLAPVQPAIYGRIERDDYTIEKVTLESLPGLFITGNLYRPKLVAPGSKLPAVLCPHGHWTEARFLETPPREVNNLLASGAERFESAARNHIQARCVQLARMGCLVFHWDMLGYCDSLQISFDRAHKYGEQPPQSERSDQGWLLFSPWAEMNCQSILGIQSLAIQRAVDMLVSLPEVDPARIAITGASGGGTQSFIGAALDERISVAFPAVMVSTGMQGGCTCENASLLRVGTGNVEMAALIAPRPLGLTAANDWTKNMAEDGFPELQKLYGLYRAQSQVALFPAVHFNHNFNHISRVAMYGWMNDHLKLGFEKPILERDFEVAERPELTVWDQAHPQPESGEAFERRLLKHWSEMNDAQLSDLLESQPQRLAEILHNGWSVCLGLTTLPTPPQLPDVVHNAQSDSITLTSPSVSTWSLSPWSLSTQVPSPPQGSADPASTPLLNKDDDHAMQMASWQRSPSSLSLSATSRDGTVHQYFPVLAGQALQSDSGNIAAVQAVQQALVENPRLAACYTYGYNVSLFAQRAQQLGQTILWLSQEHPGATIAVSGSDAEAALAAAGVFVAQYLTTAKPASLPTLQLKLAPNAYTFATVASIRDPNFVPGAARFWDLPGLIACLNAPVELVATRPQDYQRVAGLVELAGGSLTVALGN